MRNSLRNSLPSSWMKAAIRIYLSLPERLSAVRRRLKPAHQWMMGGFLCVLLLGGLSLLARERSTRKDTSTPSSAAGGAAAAPTHASSAKENNTAPAATTPAPKESAPEKGEPANAPALPPGQQAFQRIQTQKTEPEEENEQDNVRARAQWFHDQRAYPFKHIPPGALQKAYEQRDAMANRQKLLNAGKLSPQAILAFPGDGLWHLMGPQPTNRPFGNIAGLGNSGFPTTSGRVTAVAVDPSDATGNTVYIGGAAGGVWKTTDGGTTWTALTDAQPSLAIGSIAIDPNNPSTIYVGTGEDDFNIDGYYGAGILKSTNGGATWTQLGASVFAVAKSSGVGGAQIGSIAVQPGNSSVVLAAVDFFDGNDPNGGIYQSLDGGNTWGRPTAGAQGSAGVSVVFDPAGSASSTGATAYAALGDIFHGASTNGVWKSTDSGAHWTQLAGGLPTTNVGRVNLAYARSTTGATATIYAAIADSSTTSMNLLGLFKTSNAGAAAPTWTQLTNAPTFCNSQCFYDIALGVHPTLPNTIVVGGGAFTDNFTSLFESTDGGTTWTGTSSTNDFSGPATGTHPHVDTHAIVFTGLIASNGGNPRLYVGNDGGMWRTDNPSPGASSPTWVDLNAQLALTQFYPGTSAGVGDENIAFGGTQDNDTQAFNGTLAPAAAWSSVQACGDGGFTAIDNQFPTSIYTDCAPGSGPGLVSKSVFNGQNVGGNPTFVASDNGIAHESSLFIPPLAIDDSTSSPNLYYGTCHVWQTMDGANTWQAITGDLPSGTNTLGAACSGAGSITNFDISHQNTSIVVAGTSNGKIWETLSASAGAGSSWTEIDNIVPGQLPNRHVTAVRTKRSDSTGQIVYATFSGFGSCTGCDGKGHVFKTTNGGTTWTDISGDLPDAPVNDIIVNHNGSPTFDALYIASDVGVFSCPNPEAASPCKNWTVVGDGLPNSPVLSLAMRRSSRILRAATHGRSMWDIQLTDVQPPSIASLSSLTPAAALVGDPTTSVIITGVNFSSSTQVLFNGVSIGTPTFVSTTQLTLSVNSSFFQDGAVYQVSVSDPAGADTGSLPFTVMNPIVSPLTLSTGTTNTYTALNLQFTGTGFDPSTTVTFTDVANVLPPIVLNGTPASGGTVFNVSVSATTFTTPATYNVTPTNPLPGGGGNGFFPNFIVTQNPNALAIFSPSPIVLGPQATGGTTPVLNVTITNPGGADLHITAQTIAGTGVTPATNFAFATPTTGTSCNFPSSGQSGSAAVTVTALTGSCTFGMTFTPDAATGNVTRTGTLTIADNGSGNPQVVQIIGLLPSAPSPLAVLTPNPVNFGPVPIGTTSPTMIATLTSVGTQTVNVTSTGFTISGTDQADFHLLSASGTNPACPLPPNTFSLTTGQACDIGVTFSPTTPARVENAVLNVADNVTLIPQNTALTGSGVEITSISPSVVATGGPAFTLTVNGGGFASSAVVNVGPNGTNPRLTTFVSATQLQASIPASDIATAGSLPISVTTPNPGGVASEPKTLIIAQAPPATNDNVNFATNASATPFRVTQDTTHATAQLTAFTGSPATPIDPTPCGSGSTAKSVWFQFTAPATGKVVADTRFSSYTTNLSSWTISTALPSSTATFSPIACNPGTAVPASGSQVAESLITFPVTSGTTYYVMVTDPAGVGGTLTFSLDFSSTVPANDAFSNVTNIAAAPFSTSENTILATANTGAPDPVPTCASGTGLVSSGDANSVWFKFTAPSAGTITADTLTSPYDTILTAVTGAPGSFTQVACNDNATIGSATVAQSQVSFAASSGTTYFFMVSAFLGDGGTTNFHLTFTAGGAGAPAKVAFTTQPTNVAAGASITPAVQVTIQDALGNTVTTANNSVTIAIGTNPSGGTLSGTTTVAAVNGVATFSNLSINNVGTGYTLSASSTGLTGATSSAFNVTAGAATKLAFTTQPSNVAVGASIAPGVQVTVQDALGNTVTTATNLITIAIGTNPSAGTLSGTTSVAAVNGVATFSNLSINKVGTGYTLGASATGLTSATSSAFNVTAGAANKLAFSVQPSNVAAGASIAPAVQVTVQDAFGNTVTTANNSITMAIGTNPSAGTLSGTTSVAAVNGIATFSNLSINNTGTGYTLAASATSLTGATSSAFNVTTSTATKLAFTVQPSNVAAGASITPAVQVTIQDAFGNTVTSANNSITIAIGTNPSGGTLSGTTSVNAVNGVATFSSLSINKAGTSYTLGASAVGLTAATSTAFNVTPGAANKLAFTVQPSNVAAGASITPALQVAVQDAAGNTITTAANPITIAIGTNPSAGTLSGTTTVAAVNGVATFPNLSINKAGTGYTVSASASGLTAATSTAFNVTAGGATQLVFSVQPTNVSAGAAITPAVQVTVEDAQGNIVATAVNPVTMAIGTNPSAGTLSGTTTVAAVNGVATFSNLSINNAGSGYTLAASATGLTSATSTAFSVTSGTATKLVFTAQPSNVLAGSSISPSVQVSIEDAGGNLVTAATNAVTIAIGTNPSGGTLSGTLTANAVAGVATFSNLSINKVGTGYTLGASAGGLSSATSAAFNVTAGSASKLVYTAQPSNVVAGVSIAPAVAVSVEDAQGNLVTTAANPITIAIANNPSAGTLSGTTTVAAINGVATFSNLSINKVGTGYTLGASATGLTSATSSAFNVTAGAANKLAFSVQPSNVAAGASITPAVQVTVQDAQGNTVSTASNSITVAIGTNPSAGTLSGTTSVAAVNGVATFSNLSINNTGTGYTLTAGATGLIGATSSAFNVSAAAASKLVFSVQPSNVGAGSSITPAVQVTVEDSLGNTVTTANNAITIAIGTNPSSGALSGTTTVNATNGVATFSNLSISKSGTGYTLTASATGLTTATSSAFNVTSGTATKLAFTVQPSNVGAGSSITPAVQIAVEDAQGNVVTTAVNSITIAIGTNPSGGTLSGTTSVNAVNGVATFSNLGINNTGTGYTLAASTAGLTSATSNAFNVTSGVAAKLAFTAQPSNVGAGASITPAVAVSVEDAQGNVVTSATTAITIAIGTNPSGGALSGTTTVNAVSGVATFSSLSINKLGVGYTLSATATGLTAAVSSAFSVTPGAASKLIFTVQPSSAAAGASIAPAIQVSIEDAQGNVVTTANNSITMAIGTNPSAGTLSGTTSVAAVNGVAIFSNLSINKAGVGYTLSATATGLTGAASSAFNINAGTAVSIATSAGTPQSVAINTAFTNLQALVADGLGNPVSGAVVTFTINPAAGGASASFTGANTATTNAQGIATANTLTANGVTGSYTVVAGVNGVVGTAIFNLTNLAGTPTTITAVSGTPQTVLVNTAFATLKALVKDSGGNPVSGVAVTFTAPANGASGTFPGATAAANANTDATGTASAPAFTANFTNGAYVVNATVANVAGPAPFALTNNAGVPTLTSLAPASTTAGGLSFQLTVNGTNFATTSVVSFNGVAKATTFVNGTQLTATITAADIAIAATVNVSVTTPAPGGGPSGILPFAINNPLPTITSLAPSSATAGGAAFVLTVNGTNFVAASQVSFNGGFKATAFKSATQVTANISAADIANAGVFSVTVTNPGPGGGTSTPATQFTVNNTQPTGVSLSPSSTLAGATAFTLTVNGNGFLNGATITFNTTQKATTFVNSTQLTAPITAADVAKAGTINVSVTNPAPVTGPIVVLTFTVNNPVPTITGATAGGQTHVAGGAAFTLTVNGTNFNSSSVVNFGTKAETTTLVSATQVTASVPASDANTAGPVNVTVVNPAPGGGPTPTSITFTVDGYTIAGPGAAVTVKAGVTATIPITLTPSANGFANPVVFSVTGLPKDATLTPITVTPGNAKSTVNLMITTVARSSAPPSSPTDRPLPPVVRLLLISWMAALLAGIYVAILIRRTPRLRRYVSLVPLILLLISGGVLAGCASAMKGTPAGTSQLVVTATSGTFTQSTAAGSVTLTVQ